MSLTGASDADRYLPKGPVWLVTTFWYEPVPQSTEKDEIKKDHVALLVERATEDLDLKIEDQGPVTEVSYQLQRVGGSWVEKVAPRPSVREKMSVIDEVVVRVIEEDAAHVPLQDLAGWPSWKKSVKLSLIHI